MEQIIIGKNDDGRRVDNIAARYLPGAGKAFIYKMLRKKNIVLNDKRAEGNERVAEGDVLKFYLAQETLAKFKEPPGTAGALPDNGGNKDLTFDFSKAVVYEDEDVIIINKPARMLSQKALPTDVSVNEYLIEYCLETGRYTKEELETFKPAVCNRLDRNTSGLVCAGVSIKGLRELSRLIRERKLEKYYICVVSGRIVKETRLVSYLKKDAKTNKVEVRSEPFSGADRVELEFRPFAAKEPSKGAHDVFLAAFPESEAVTGTGANKETTRLEVRLITGKSHQIRAQLSAIGHPIIGDPKYGDGKGRFQLLCAYRLVFPKDTELERLAGREIRITDKNRTAV